MRWVAVAVVAVIAGCGDNKHVPDAAVPGDAPADMADGAAALAFVSAPVFSLPNPAAPLSGRITLETNRPTRVAVRVTSAARTYDVPVTALATQHAVSVLELRADTAHTIAVTVTDAGGAMLVAAPIEITTAPLPVFAPPITTTQIVPGSIEPGFTLIAFQRLLFAVDRDGTYVWLIDMPVGVSDVTLLPSGRFLVLASDRVTAFEIDAFGTVSRTWRATNRSTALAGEIAVATDSFHHELVMEANGDLLALGSERREYASYPTSETDPTPRAAPVGLIGDTVEAFGADGTIKASYALLDALDPYRVAWDSFGAFWTTHYAPNTALDWSHGNGLARDPSDGGVLVSLRHQDALVKLDAAGELMWILGTHDNWSPAFANKLLAPVGTSFAWPFHQHAPAVLANGNILLFDNGNYRVSPPTPRPTTGEYSRAVEYAVDPVAKEIRQVWEYDANRTIFAAATGDVDIGAQTGNVIVTFGITGTVIEVTHTTPPVEVWRLESQRALYRSRRVRSLYP